MNKFGFAGIWEHPASTIPSLMAGIGMIVVGLGWCDAKTWETYSLSIGGVLISLIGSLYKGKQ